MTLLETVAQPVAATGLFSLAWLLVAIPAASAALLLVLGGRSDKWGHWLGTAAPIASFVLGALLFVDLLGRDEASRSVETPLWTWFASGSWEVNFGMQIDQLSILFVLLVTGVGSLIHVYSIGYMSHDPARRRFFAYLNLFIAAMLILVLANNYLVLFLGWEGVGLASYLLIGFWYQKPSAATAGNKAFIVNRVGDLGLAMAVFTMLNQFGSANFTVVNEHASDMSPVWATLLGFFLLLAACGKSAQVPLQSWLLDAMEGPTPVSALIHAATMVTAGVYLVVRSHAIYAMTPTAQLAVAIVGTVTLLFGAWIGCAKDDIKKVLAGSTMSQIGYMMLAAGIGPAGYAFAIFHLLTHGFFKANMFLGAGSVMHGMNDDVDMRHYGALAKAMPVTFWTFAMGFLAIIGFPGFAGYYSKDHIIEAAYHQNPVLGVLALIGAGVTAFYMTRLMAMTFGGTKRWLLGVHPHESPWAMTVPLIVLAVMSVIGGILMNNWIGHWLAPATTAHVEHMSLFHISTLGIVTMLVVAVGVVVGWLMFGRREIPAEAPKTKNVLVIAGRHDLFGDTVNETLLMRPGQGLVAATGLMDKHMVDGAVRRTATTFTGLGQLLRKLQDGYVRSYGVILVFGIVLIGVVIYLGQIG